MKWIYLAFWIIVFSLISCHEDGDWDEVKKISPNENTQHVLDSIFSDQNSLITNREIDKLLIVINSLQDFNTISDGPDTIQLDFEKYALIGCKFTTSSISNTIADAQLLFHSNTMKYKYVVSVDKCESCWTAIGNLYSWGIYPKISQNENVELQIK